jgi:hypothetical protein
VSRSAAILLCAALAVLVAPLTGAGAQVRGAVPTQGTAHPAMAGFLAALASGDRDEAAARISRIGDFPSLHFSAPLAFDATREEFAAFLANCTLTAADFRGRGGIPTHDTEWSCPDGKHYLVQFLPEDAMFVETTRARPYLWVTLFESTEMRAEREAARLARRAPANAMPPQPVPVMSEADQRQAQARRQREEQDAVGYRDRIGEAVVRGDIEAIAAYATPETEVRYATHDIFFDVSLEHQRARGGAGIASLLQRAVSELGTPVSANCFLPRTRWAPHVCRWTMSNRANGLYAQMNFSGPNGMLSSIRFFRETAEESEVLGQRARSAGL